jgi:hypothetical protein
MVLTPTRDGPPEQYRAVGSCGHSLIVTLGRCDRLRSVTGGRPKAATGDATKVE